MHADVHPAKAIVGRFPFASLHKRSPVAFDIMSESIIPISKARCGWHLSGPVLAQARANPSQSP
jgi:hypothetical protein